MSATSANSAKTLAFTLMGVGSTLAGFAIVLSTALVATANEGHPNGVGGIAKGTIPALRAELKRELAPNGNSISFKVPVKDEARASRLLAASPLDANALTYLGFAADERGERNRARLLMTLALRSEERSLRARLWLLDDALRHRDYVTAINHFDRLAAQGVPGNTALIAAMAAITKDPASHAPLARALASNPPWRSSFLYALNRQGVSPDVIYRLTPQDSARRQALSEQSALLQSLLKKHEFDRAYLAWINFLPAASLDRVGPVFDPQFENLAGPAPFNWRLSDTADGSSEFRKPRGLVVSYLGSVAATLVEQTLLLGPGSYHLSVTATGSDDNSQLSWTVTCSDVGAPLQTLPMNNLQANRQRYTTTFTIPASDCGSQRLALVGSPSEFPRAVDAAIDSIAIESVK